MLVAPRLLARNLASDLPDSRIPIHPHVFKKLRPRGQTRHQQMIPRAGAGNVQQVAFGVIDLLQVGVVTDRLDALLQRDDLVVAGHHHHGAELQALREMHAADRHVPAGRLDVFIENLVDEPR